MSDEIIMVEEHYSTTIARGLANRMELSRGGSTDDASNTHRWADLWSSTEAWAQEHGHPTVAGTYPVFLNRSYHQTYDGAACDEGDIEISRVSASYARAIDDMRRAPSIVLKADGTIVYLVGAERRERVRQLIENRGLAAITAEQWTAALKII